jgi:hypothetical protein
MQYKRTAKSAAVVITLNALLVAVFGVSSWCYLSVSRFAAGGGDPLGLLFLYVVSFPALIVLGTLLTVLKNRLHLPLANGLVAFAGIPALILPLFADITRFPIAIGWVGFGAGVALAAATVAITAFSLLSPRPE